MKVKITNNPTRNVTTLEKLPIGSAFVFEDGEDIFELALKRNIIGIKIGSCNYVPLNTGEMIAKIFSPSKGSGECNVYQLEIDEISVSQVIPIQ